MGKTINFCGDSYCADADTDWSWPVALSHLLQAKIIGLGKGGSAHEHAFKTFDTTADYTVFCWTEAHRIYHPLYAINMASCEHKPQREFQAARDFYKYLHDYDLYRDKQHREFYWFDHKILSNYKGIVLHFWCFENTYDWKHGTVLDYTLFSKTTDDRGLRNHMTEAQNLSLANDAYKLIRRYNG